MLDLIRNINPTEEHINEYVYLPDGKVVHRYGILCTSYVDYQVWEPTKLGAQPHHNLITTIEGKWYGSITSRPLPPELEAMPGWKSGFWSVARIAAVQDWRTANEAEAEAIIRSTFPQDFCEEGDPQCKQCYGKGCAQCNDEIYYREEDAAKQFRHDLNIDRSPDAHYRVS